MPSATCASCSHSSLSAAKGREKGRMAAATSGGREEKTRQYFIGTRGPARSEPGSGWKPGR